MLRQLEQGMPLSYLKISCKNRFFINYNLAVKYFHEQPRLCIPNIRLVDSFGD